jgi:hypothetical protein
VIPAVDDLWDGRGVTSVGAAVIAVDHAVVEQALEQLLVAGQQTATAHDGYGVHAVLNGIAGTALNQPIDIDGVQSRGALFKRFQTGRSSCCRARLATASPARQRCVGRLVGAGGAIFPVTLGIKRIAGGSDTLSIARQQVGPR